MRKIGIDIVKVSRFTDFINDKRKYARILSEKEIAYFESISSPNRRLEFLAGRFAAKEAIIKAVSGSGISFDYNELSVLNDENGAPYLESEKLKDFEIMISLSHSETDAVAVAVCI
ncbi:MAG TPA: holo-ACP synthase [Bacilli bacterium]